jgi:hypothetical protein
MVQERIKQFTGDPAHIEIILNQFLEQSSDNIEVIGFRVVDTEIKGSSSAPRNVLYLLYRLKSERIK